MTIEGKTQADKVRKHSSNLQKTVGRLKTILPRSSSAELQTMAEDILRKSSPGYGDAMSKLKITSKEFNANYLLNFRGDLRTYTDDEDGLTNADIVDLRERFTGKKIQITPENAEATETITGILDTKYKENFNVEFKRILIHGILHLLGYIDDTTDKKKLMTDQENKYIKLNSKTIINHKR